jgi:hypothetical protein
MSSGPPATFRTHNVQLAVAAQANPEATLESVDTSDPRLVYFEFSGIPADYHVQVLQGKVTVNARDVLAAQKTIHEILQDARRSAR